MDINKALDDLIVFHLVQGLDTEIAMDMAIYQQEKPSNDSRKMLNAAYVGILQQEKNRRAELKDEFEKFIEPLA